MLAVLRFDVPRDRAAQFQRDAGAALDVLAACTGWRSARVARAVDVPDEWMVTLEWDSVGDYRRALSSFEVKGSAVPFLSAARDEPSAFEVVEARGLGAEGLQTGSGRSDEPPVARW